jgi:hypothetical protein
MRMSQKLFLTILISTTLAACSSGPKYEGRSLGEVINESCSNDREFSAFFDCVIVGFIHPLKTSNAYESAPKRAKKIVTELEYFGNDLKAAVDGGAISDAEAIYEFKQYRRQILAREEERDAARRKAYSEALQGMADSLEKRRQDRQRVNCTSNRIGNQVFTNCY